MQSLANIRDEVNQLLVRRYKDFNPGFNSDKCDYRMLNAFYDVIGDSEILTLYGNMDSYLLNHSDYLKKVISLNLEAFIFDQPAYLFVYFSLWHWNNQIINQWPYDYESLLSVVRWSGFSVNAIG